MDLKVNYFTRKFSHRLFVFYRLVGTSMNKQGVIIRTSRITGPVNIKTIQTQEL